MRILGIDYGTKRVGLALTDAGGRLALPYAVLANSGTLLARLQAICEKEGVTKIVIGESRDFRGRPNLVMRKIVPFVALLARQTRLPVEFEPEFLTTVEAARPAGRDQMLDARAASLILRTYLDRQCHARNP